MAVYTHILDAELQGFLAEFDLEQAQVLQDRADGDRARQALAATRP